MIGTVAMALMWIGALLPELIVIVASADGGQKKGRKRLPLRAA